MCTLSVHACPYFALEYLENLCKYVSLTGRHKGVPEEERQSQIGANTVLLDLVSGVPSGKDCIHRVMTDIVSILLLCINSL